MAGTLQMPFPRAEMWRERLSEPPEGLYSLVACVEGEVVGSLGLVHARAPQEVHRHRADLSHEDAYRQVVPLSERLCRAARR